MFAEIDKRFEYLLNILSAKNANLDIVIKAYNKAKQLHFYQKRKDGTPYLSHPLEVAIILAELGFNEDAVCGALLHDTIEDCGYTVEKMKQEFNNNIAEMVDAVSAIDKTKYIYDKNDLYEDPNFVKSSAEEQTFKKLISIGKKIPLGFCIKFADRLHNLRTINTFERAKQLEKVRETEKWVLPIAKALKAEYFYIQIKNECFKIIHKLDGDNFFEQYNMYHKSNQKKIDSLTIKLKEVFSDKNIADVMIDSFSERKVFDQLKKLKKNINIKDVSQGQLIKVPNYSIYIIFKTGLDKNTITNAMLSKFNSDLKELKIVSAEFGNFSEMPYFVVKDNIKNYYRLYILSDEEYQKLRIGTLDGRYNDSIDEDNINNLDVDLIKVKTRSGEIKQIAKHSTVLDFAFKIHKDIGFAFKYAIINDGKTKFPPYTKLNEGDKVEIVVDKDENGNLKNNAQLRWLAYVNTELAKRVLIKWFDK